MDEAEARMHTMFPNKALRQQAATLVSWISAAQCASVRYPDLLQEDVLVKNISTSAPPLRPKSKHLETALAPSQPGTVDDGQNQDGYCYDTQSDLTGLPQQLSPVLYPVQPTAPATALIQHPSL